MSVQPEEFAPLPTEPTSTIANDLSIGNYVADTIGYQSVVSLYASARFVEAPRQDLRRIWDSEFPDFLDEVVTFAHRQWWDQRKRVLIRDFSGLNRCGLVAALVLMRTGWTAEDAIYAVQEGRSPYALCKPSYLNYLRSLS